jgi:hypothetical protein
VFFKRVKCKYCGRVFSRSLRQVNEARKFGWRTFCSSACQSGAKNFQLTLSCSRSGCNKVFKRIRNQYLKFGVAYCSRTCAAIVNNKKYPKRSALVRQCVYCGRDFVSRKKYCSRLCKDKDHTISKETLINKIRTFYKKERRIPLKREFGSYRAIRGRFGTWNNAILEAGFNPNPVMFANKFVSKDGHKCDSMAERIIDDWFYSRKTRHERNTPYPGNHGLKVDFKVGDFWVEFFGLSGEHKRYDQLKRKKLRLAKKFGLKLVAIYPRHLFPKSKLSEKFAFLLK